MQIRQLAAAPAAAPLGGQHPEIERMRALDLEPARTAIAGLVRSSERLCTFEQSDARNGTEASIARSAWSTCAIDSAA
jgi:hypothetical protein